MYGIDIHGHMVEVDRWLLNTPPELEIGDDGFEEEEETSSSGSAKRREHNYVKGNSLGLLFAAESHERKGPAILHWEGGWAGEIVLGASLPQVDDLLSLEYLLTVCVCPYTTPKEIGIFYAPHNHHVRTKSIL